jgi:GxxExxY protein
VSGTRIGVERHPVSASTPTNCPVQGLRLDCGYRLDLLVERELIIELKSVEKLRGIHEAQLLTYMKLAASRPDC